MAKTVAVVGASSDRRKYGNKALRAYREEGYTVFPINPHQREVEGIPAYRSVLDVPGPIDMATVYVPPQILIGLLDDFQKKHIPEIWINPGAEDDDVMREAKRRGLNTIFACSIIGVGRSPTEF
jgi:predicted CoA-binding protein